MGFTLLIQQLGQLAAMAVNRIECAAVLGQLGFQLDLASFEGAE